VSGMHERRAADHNPGVDSFRVCRTGRQFRNCPRGLPLAGQRFPPAFL
jgi:hypothetical protein